MFRPSAASQMTTPLALLIPKRSSSLGVATKTYTEADGLIMANFKTFGGTEVTNNGTLVIEDTAEIVCWFRPDIASDCRIKRLTDGAVFDIMGDPENVEMRNQFLIFKVRRVKGGL